MEGLGINLGYLLMQIFLFIILYLVLRNYLYEPVIKALEERKQRIAKGLEDARQAAIARDNADAEAKKIMDAARAEAAKLRQEASVQAEEQASSIVHRANDEARQVMADAQEDAEEERNRILSEVRGQVVAIAMAATSKLVGESLDKNRQHELIDEFFTAVPADVQATDGQKVSVTSAIELTDKEKARVQKELGTKDITYRVDPSILGGLVVRVGDQVVDNSVAAQMSAMRESLR